MASLLSTRPVVLLLLTTILALLVATGTSQNVFPSLPANIAVSVVFPRNTTYGVPPKDSLPVVLALQGANAAYTFGFTISWRVRRATACEQGDCAVADSGQMAVPVGQFPDGLDFGKDDTYFFTDRISGLGATGYVGPYLLEWDFGFARNCSGGEDAGALVSESGRVAAAGSTVFSMGEGTFEPVVLDEQVDECPLAAGRVGVQADLSGCPRLGETGLPETDVCKVVILETVKDVIIKPLVPDGDRKKGLPAGPKKPKSHPSLSSLPPGDSSSTETGGKNGATPLPTKASGTRPATSDKSKAPGTITTKPTTTAAPTAAALAASAETEAASTAPVVTSGSAGTGALGPMLLVSSISLAATAALLWCDLPS